MFQKIKLQTTVALALLAGAVALPSLSTSAYAIAELDLIGAASILQGAAHNGLTSGSTDGNIIDLGFMFSIGH
jgi:hypothetical protein